MDIFIRIFIFSRNNGEYVNTNTNGEYSSFPFNLKELPIFMESNYCQKMHFK